MTGRLTWAALEPIVRTATAPSAIRLEGEPRLILTYDPSTHELALRLPAMREEPLLSRLAAVRIERHRGRTTDELVISTRSSTLHQYFFDFVMSVAERVQVEKSPTEAAIEHCLAQWKRLLVEHVRLSREAELGLLGELWTLRELIGHVGPEAAVDGWTGPLGEAHDFRLASVDLEVKTTSGERRLHRISSETQLEQSPGRPLLIVSLQYAEGGSTGSSLAQECAALWADVPVGRAREGFTSRLAAHGLDAEQVARYEDRWILRTQPRLIKVDDDFPRLASADVPVRFRQRIERISYLVDVTDLGSVATPTRWLEVVGGQP